MKSDIFYSKEELHEHHSFIVDKNNEIIRIDKFLMLRVPNSTRSKIQKCINSGNVFCNDKIIKSNYKVKPGDIIKLKFEFEPINKEIIPEDIPLNVVFEDDNIVVINKKSNMVVHPSYGHYSGTLVHAILHRFKDIKGDFNNERPGLVHRLDKNTTGLIVIARNEVALTNLSSQFSDRTIKRTYFALVWGDFDKDKGTITGFIGRDKKNRKKMTVYDSSDHGKQAITHFEVIERFRYVTLIKCNLETGRTHQIRVHMSHIGHPIFNDDEYGGDKILRGTTFSKYRQFVNNCFKILPRQALHAKLLSFLHPITKKKVSFECELPEDFSNILHKWRNYIKNHSN